MNKGKIIYRDIVAHRLMQITLPIAITIGIIISISSSISPNSNFVKSNPIVLIWIISVPFIIYYLFKLKGRIIVYENGFYHYHFDVHFKNHNNFIPYTWIKKIHPLIFHDTSFNEKREGIRIDFKPDTLKVYHPSLNNEDGDPFLIIQNLSNNKYKPFITSLKKGIGNDWPKLYRDNIHIEAQLVGYEYVFKKQLSHH